jgi:hypothetical protein
LPAPKLPCREAALRLRAARAVRMIRSAVEGGGAVVGDDVVAQGRLGVGRRDALALGQTQDEIATVDQGGEVEP